MFTRKSILTVSEAVRIAYESSDAIIHGIIFVMEVRRILARPGCPDSTIMRELSRLRADGLINYRAKNRYLSIFEKLPLIPKA